MDDVYRDNVKPDEPILGEGKDISGQSEISPGGQAVLRSPNIGGQSLRYVVTDSGIFSFGDGSDGEANCDGSTAVTGMTLSSPTYTLTRDVYFTKLTVSVGISIDPAGYRIFVSDTLTLNGTILGDGTAGADQNDTQPQQGGAARSLADGYLKGSPATGKGGTGAPSPSNGGGAGNPGTNTINSLGFSAVAGGLGGESTTVGGRSAGGAGGTVTAANVKLIANWHLATLLDVSSTGSTVKFDNSAGAGGGGGGNSSVGGVGKGGGGGGVAGRIVAIYARRILISATGSITANGGKGGNGGSGGAGAGGGGGGGGGNGGIVILVFNVMTNDGTITVNAGVGGTAGGSGGVNPATNGTDGSAGVIYEFSLSL